MKVDAVKVHAVVAFNAMTARSGSEFDTAESLTFSASKPIKIETTKLTDGKYAEFFEEGKAPASMFGRIVRGAGVKYLHTLTCETNDIVALKDEGDKQRVEHYVEVRVLSEFDQVMQVEEWTPLDLAKKLFKNKPLTVEQKEANEVMTSALDNSIKRRDFGAALGVDMGKDEKFNQMVDDAKRAIEVVAGWKDSDKGKRIGDLPGAQKDVLRKLIEGYAERKGIDKAEIMRKAGAMDLASESGTVAINVEQLDGTPMLTKAEDMRFVSMQATDLHNIGVEHGDHFHDAANVRLVHVGDPVYHDADDSMREHGYVGYWQFDVAAVATTEIPAEVRASLPEDENVQLSFGYSLDGSPLRLAVRDAGDSISPAGQIAVPSVLFEKMTGKAPEHTMSYDDSEAFNKVHMVPWPGKGDQLERHPIFGAPAPKAVSRKAN